MKKLLRVREIMRLLIDKYGFLSRDGMGLAREASALLDSLLTEGPVRNQGDLGSCTANAGSEAIPVAVRFENEEVHGICYLGEFSDFPDGWYRLVATNDPTL